MITYFRMKKNEWKVKALFYGLIVNVMNEQTDIIEFIQKLYTSLKDVPADQLRSELMGKIAELAHQQAVKERETEKGD